jgi:hypothetical protein
MLCALSGVTPTDFLVCTALPGDTTTNCLLYSACRYYDRLSAALPYLSKLQLPSCSTDYPLCSLLRYSSRLSAILFSFWRYYNQASAPLYLSILQPTIRSTLSVDALLSLALLESTICCDLLNLSILQPTSYVLYSTLSAMNTTNYPLCSETATASFRRETERLFAQL